MYLLSHTNAALARAKHEKGGRLHRVGDLVGNYSVSFGTWYSLIDVFFGFRRSDD